MNSDSQPLDIGRLSRVIPDGMRRAVAARDRGCARCGRPASWCDIHHVVEWQNGGPTEINNLVMLCRMHHREIHATEWIVRMVDGLPEFIPPRYIDPDQVPRRRPGSERCPQFATGQKGPDQREQENHRDHRSYS
ncbi:HNH endonuclease signature motif containing protein [Pseudonocardia sp. TRM90224]|uniref:HNH endonuclease signature motif containing protein n=1 Tax=Pseudonocardia sp. TRM90224 TaxID=2812678 RepID=UPI0035A8DA5F